MDLRVTASGMHEKTTDLSGLLAQHMACVRADLGNHIEHMMSLIKQRAEALQKESSRQLEADLAELRLENRALHDQLKRPPVYPAETDESDPTGSGRRHKVSAESSSTQFDKSLHGSDPADQSSLTTDLTGASASRSFQDKEFLQPAAADSTSLSTPRASRGPRPSRSFAHTLSEVSQSTKLIPQSIRRSKLSAKSRIFGNHSSKSVKTEANSAAKKPFDMDAEERRKRNEAMAGHAVFADATAMKERVRAAITKPEYNVSDYYWDSGICQAIARHQLFEQITLFVIAFNAVWISIDADNNDKQLLLDADPIFQIAEHGFCTFFTFEWVVRFLAFRKKRFGLRDAWFCFDTALVVIMILETWIMTLMFVIFGLSQSGGVGNTSVLKLIRLVRLTRMARMAKLLRAIPELIILIKGIWVAARSVVFTLVLLGIIIYVFAIVFRQLTDDTDIGEKYYRSVPDAMASLLLDGVLPDQAPIVRDNSGSHLLLGFLQLFFILLSSLTVMNMLVGVLCEVVSVVSAVEKEQLTVNYVKQKLQTMFTETDVDMDGSQTISRVEFARMLENSETASIIQDLGVDVIGLVDFADVIFEEDTELSFPEFMEVVLQLRGSNHCTVKDMVDFRKFVVSELNAVQQKTIQEISELLGANPEVLPIVTSKSSMQKSISFKTKPMLFGSQAHTELPGSIIT